MQSLRNTRILARLVLVWFGLTLAAAIASPMVRPQAYALVCSGAGPVKMLTVSGDGDGDTPAGLSHTFDCPACASPAAPPPAVRGLADFPLRPDPALPPAPATRVAARPAAPLPARGPPAAS